MTNISLQHDMQFFMQFLYNCEN